VSTSYTKSFFARRLVLESSQTLRPGDNPPTPRKRPNTRSTHTHRLFDFLKSNAVTGGRFRRRCALYGSKPAGQHFSGNFCCRNRRFCRGCACPGSPP
jgi:hypothetical protein